MSFFKKLFSKKTKTASPPKQPAPKFDVEEFKSPKTITVEGAYKVHCFLSEVPTCDNERTITCKSFLSEGMIAVGQQEVILTIALPENQEDWEYLTFTNIQGIFDLIYIYAEKGMTVVDGNHTSLSGGSNILGFTGVIYANHPEKVSNEVPDDCLSIVLLHQRELKIGMEMGYMKMLTMLGKAELRYPFPIWNDIKRPEAELVGHLLEHSVLKNRISRISDKGSAFIKSQTLYFQLSKSSMARNESFWKHPRVFDNKIFAVLTSFNHDIKLCKTWSMNLSYINLLSGHTNELKNGDHKILGSFVMFVAPNIDENPSITQIEDGFSVEFTNRLWENFVKAIKTQSEFGFDTESKKGGDLIGFRLEWID